MDELKQWALLLCTAVTAGGIVDLLLPSGNCGRVGKMVVSFFILSCFLIPVNNLRIDVHSEFERSKALSAQWQEELTQGTEELSYSLAKDHILKLIQARLEQQNCTVLNLDADFKNTEEVSIQIKITLPNEEQWKEAELRSLMLTEYGIKDVEFIWQEGQ